MREIVLTTGRQVDGVWRSAGETVTVEDGRAAAMIAAGQALPAADAANDAAPSNRMKATAQRR
jgi:hypothetical protein